MEDLETKMKKYIYLRGRTIIQFNNYKLYYLLGLMRSYKNSLGA